MSPGLRGESRLRVRYAETDQMGVVYHTHYLVWCEIGRTDLIRRLGLTYAEIERDGLFLAVSEARIRYHASARYDDEIRVVTTLERVRSRLLDFSYDIARIVPGAEPERLASATTTLVSLGGDGRPRALPASLLARFQEAVSEPPA